MKKYIYLLLIPILIIIDQVIKYLVTHGLKLFGYTINYIINDKMILGYGGDYDIFFYIIILLILFLAIFVIEKPEKQNIAFIIMISGALSNLIDRIYYHGVIDYLHFGASGKINFNLADIYLVFGFFMYLFLLGRENEKKAHH
jgi:signal peptidase II